MGRNGKQAWIRTHTRNHTYKRSEINTYNAPTKIHIYRERRERREERKNGKKSTKGKKNWTGILTPWIKLKKKSGVKVRER